MGLIINSDNLTTMLINKIEGVSQSDYTIITSDEQPPLYAFAREFENQYPGHSVHSNILISEITDPAGRYNRSCPKLWIETKMVANLIPGLVLERLLSDSITVEYNDGQGSYYDPVSVKASIKGAQDFLHEIGHHIWNCWLIRDDEPEKKIAVNHSLSDGSNLRRELPDHLIPDSHKEYASMVGAYSGQFMEDPQKTEISKRKNDLEENFARNFDCFIRGRVLDVSYMSRICMDDLLSFFNEYRLSDEGHTSLYRYILRNVYGRSDLNIVNPENAMDGIEITRDELYRYHCLRVMFETGKRLGIIEQISLALDLSEDFIRFCISKDAIPEIREAIKLKGISGITI